MEGGVPGFGVEADLGVGEVVVVGDDEDGAASGVDLGGVAVGDVEFEAVAQGEAVGSRLGVECEVVGADGDAVGAAAAAVDGDGPGAVGFADLGGEGVDSGGAEPLFGPGVDVAVGGGGEVVDEVGEGGVGEPVAGEVGVDAGEEVLFAEPGDELPQR